MSPKQMLFKIDIHAHIPIIVPALYVNYDMHFTASGMNRLAGIVVVKFTSSLAESACSLEFRD